MIPTQDGWTIVLAGHWNRMIFTPQWVSDRLFHTAEVETLVGLPPVAPFIYRNPQVLLEVASSRLVFRPQVLNDECLQRAEEMALTVLETLRDTPLIAVGINFAFTEQNPPDELLALFNSPDGVLIAGAGWEIVSHRLTRQLRREERTLNLTLVFSGQEVQVEFNFHTDTPTNESACNAVRRNVLNLRQSTLDLVQEAYQLELVEG